MGILRKRPLAAGCLLLILCTVLAYLIPLAALLLLITAIIALGALIFLCVKRGLSYGRLYLLLLTIGVLLGCGRTLVTVVGVDRPLEQRVAETLTVQCEIEEIQYSSAYSSTVLVSVQGVEGEAISGKAVLLSEAATPFREGDVIFGQFTVAALEETDITYPATYRAEGCVVALIASADTVPILEESGSGGIRFTARRLQAFLSDVIKSHVDGEEGRLLSALLLGTKDDLSDLTVRHFRRAGLSHLLALSGLHLGILAGLLDRLLYMARLGKKARMTVVLSTMMLYLMMTGCSYSMLRSVLMLATVYLAFCLQENGDALTALALAGAVILLITPYAIFSASYQMTMLATFGILSFGGIYQAIDRRLPRGKGVLRLLWKLVRLLISSVLLTVSASVAVLPVQWLTFGEFSLATPLSNLLLTPLAAPLLVLGLLVLFAYPAPFFGWLAKLLTGLLLRAVAFIGSTDCVLSLSYDFVPYLLIPFFAIMLVLLFVDLRRYKGAVLLPVPLLIGVFALCLALHQQGLAGQLAGTYRVDRSNEGIVLSSTAGSLMIDISSGSATQLQRNWMLLQERGETELDILMLTHYHNAHVKAVSRFGKRVLIRSLWVPEPTTEADEAVLASLREVAEELCISLTVFPRETALPAFGAGTLTLSAPLYEKRSTQPAFRLQIVYGDGALCYESAAYSEFARHAGHTSVTAAATLYVPGSHGPLPKESILPAQPHEGALTVLVPTAGVAMQLPWSVDINYTYYAPTYHFTFD